MPMQLTGIDELNAKAAAIRSASNGMKAALSGSLYAALSPMYDFIKTEPNQPAPTNPKRIYIRGTGTMYVPTGKTYRTSQNYSQTTTLRTGLNSDERVSWEIYSPATYSGYLRGGLDGMDAGTEDNKPAWMHKGVWEWIGDIVDRFMPDIRDRIRVAIDDLLKGI
jgi:hypothetical protein